MAEVGLDTYKIRMMGRWNCRVVIHYTREAPISDMASGFVQAKTAREQHKQSGRVDAPLKKSRNVVEATVQDMRNEIKALNDKIVTVERKAVPGFVINRNTKDFHKTLSNYADAGPEALARCVFAYATPRASTRFESEVPADTKWREVCST